MYILITSFPASTAPYYTHAFKIFCISKIFFSPHKKLLLCYYGGRIERCNSDLGHGGNVDPKVPEMLV